MTGTSSSSRSRSTIPVSSQFDLPGGYVEIIAPAGFEKFFAGLAEIVATLPPEEVPEARAELAREYDHYFVHPEWVPELKEKHGLKLLGEE